MDDHSLLHEFLRTGNADAFSDLVRRHVDMVYAAAARQVFNPADAEDVTQKVFIQLAQRGRTIRRGEALAGWLLVTTRFVALNTLRERARRKHHEGEAASMKCEAHACDAAEWESVRPVLDAAIAELKRLDRDAVTLRYFKGQSVREIASALGVSEPAAQKRVLRAVERLREILRHKGVAVAPEILGTVLLANTVAPAPAYLAAQIVHGSVSAAASMSSLGVKGSVLMTLNMKVASGICVAMLLAVAAAPIVRRATSATAPTSGSAPVAGPAVLAASAPASRPAPPATTQAWRERFNAAYALGAGHYLKQVPPPFIPERTDYFKSAVGFQFGSDWPMPNASTFTWNGHEANFAVGMNGAELEVGELLQLIANTWPQDTDIPRKLLLEKVSGDWVYRVDATDQQKRDELCELLAEILGPQMTLKLQPLEREVIVVRGTLKSKRQQSSTTRVGKPNEVVLGAANERQTSHRVVQTPIEMLKLLGELMARPVLIEAQFDAADQAYIVTTNESVDFGHVVDPPDGAVVDPILARVAEQTSLELKRETRQVPTWRLVPAEP